MHSRRQFLGSLAAPAAAAACLHPARADRAREALRSYENDTRSPEEFAADETFWGQVGLGYTVDRSLINLNNGGVNPSTRFAQDAVKRHLDFSNEAPTYNMWRVLEPRREGVRQRLAVQFGCDPEEIAITRNASESLQILQLGFDLKRGDAVLTTDLDYPRMLTTFEQRVRRDGIELVKLPLPTPLDDHGPIIELFAEHIARHRPKLVLLCHMLSANGAVLPVRDVVRLGREHGVPVLVDGAHSFAHCDFTRDDLECDYYATSLHKWLSAPHGTGMLYVRRDRIRDLWPLMAAGPDLDEDIRKFEEIGTHPAAMTLGVGEALTFHQAIGSARKQARLVYLREYWVQRLVDQYPDRFVLHTSRAPGMAYGIATVELREVAPAQLGAWLWREHRIITTGIHHDGFRGLRISPNVYTTLEELDRFCAAMEHAMRHGLPA